MWMMGYNDGGDFNTIQDSFNGRKLRALVPRPATATANPPPCLNGRIHGADFLALNHHFGMSSEQNKRELSTQQVVVSSRWNPTPEQLQTLEELYRRGTRTPSAEQIQHITSQLRRYGKIEGKNVFYWFQNHKARERQKRRRQLESPSNLQLHDHINIQNSDKKESSQGVNRTVFEGEQTKNWASLTKSSTNTEKTSTKGSAKVTEAECKTDGWLQFEGAELQERRTLAERNATWQLMHLSCSSSSPSSLSSPTNLFINSSSSSSSISTSSSSATPAINTVPTNSTINPPISTLININNTPSLLMQQNIIHSQQYFNLFNPQNDLISSTSSAAACRRGGGGGGGGEAHTTLQLFPLGSRYRDNNNVVECDCDKDIDEEELSGGAAMDAANAAPFQYFEFLPLKN